MELSINGADGEKVKMQNVLDLSSESSLYVDESSLYNSKDIGKWKIYANADLGSAVCRKALCFNSWSEIENLETRKLRKVVVSLEKLIFARIIEAQPSSYTALSRIYLLNLTQILVIS